MLNVQTFTDLDGNEVEIDRRQLHAAHVERHGDGQVIVIEHARTRSSVSASEPAASSKLGSGGCWMSG